MLPRRSLSLFALLALAVASCLLAPLPARADDIKVDDPDVTVLTDSNFHSFIQNDLALVEFYAPWCGHCKSLAPNYGLAATQLKGEGVVLGKLDATVHQGHGVEIRGYPTLKIYRNGKMSDYNGPRTADGIVQYMKKQVGPAARTLTTQAELEALKMQDPAVQYAVVAFFVEGKPSQLQSSFSLLSNRLRDEFAFGRSTDAALAASQGVPAGKEALVAYLRGEKTVYDGSSKTADVEAWIRDHSLPLVGEFNDATAPLYHARQLPIAKLFLSVDKKGAGSKTMTYYTNRLKKIAERFAGQVLVAYADKENQKAAFESLNFDAEEVNTFAIEEPREGKWYKYDAEEYAAEEEEEEVPVKKNGKKAAPAKKGLDVQGWTHLVEDYLAGDATPYVKSQRAPKNNLDLPVKIATGNNFDELINQDDKDVMIEFYAPWCGHCRALEPKYQQLGEQLQKDPALKETILAKLDATANEFDRSAWEVSGYPTIFFKPAGKKAVKYEGAREVADMKKFIKKNAKNLQKKEKKGGKKSKKNRKSEE